MEYLELVQLFQAANSAYSDPPYLLLSKLLLAFLELGDLLK